MQACRGRWRFTRLKPSRSVEVGRAVIVTDTPQATGSWDAASLSLSLLDRIADARSRAIENFVQWGSGSPFSMGVEMMGEPAYKNINLSRGRRIRSGPRSTP
jgi:hypothetical protein